MGSGMAVMPPAPASWTEVFRTLLARAVVMKNYAVAFSRLAAVELLAVLLNRLRMISWLLF